MAALSGGICHADDLRVAVASNFRVAAEVLAHDFEQSHGVRVILIPGSTGKHYAQIFNGAPVDVFLAADARRPKLLEDAALGVPGSRFTYAVGRLALWSPGADKKGIDERTLSRNSFRFLAIANPGLAPYGAAAQSMLKATGTWDDVEGRLVMGENVSQAYQFVATGNADLGFVSLSQLIQPGRTRTGRKLLGRAAGSASPH